MADWVTKDSGKKAEYASGMKRDSADGKPRFDLMLAEGIPYDEQFLTRIAGLLQRGAVKYGDRNHEQANSQDELTRMRSSANRHLMQWLAGEEDEDHAAGVVVNLFMAESLKFRMERDSSNAETLFETEIIPQEYNERDRRHESDCPRYGQWITVAKCTCTAGEPENKGFRACVDCGGVNDFHNPTHYKERRDSRNDIIGFVWTHNHLSRRCPV